LSITKSSPSSVKKKKAVQGRTTRRKTGQERPRRGNGKKKKEIARTSIASSSGNWLRGPSNTASASIHLRGLFL
jgi:hypothetical protein